MLLSLPPFVLIDVVPDLAVVLARGAYHFQALPNLDHFMNSALVSAPSHGAC